MSPARPEEGSPPSAPCATAAGTRWHERVRLVHSWWMTVDSVIIEIDQQVVLGRDFRSIWCTGHLPHTIEATSRGSFLHQQETLLPRWPLRPMAAWADAEMSRACWQVGRDPLLLESANAAAPATLATPQPSAARSRLAEPSGPATSR